MELTKLQNGSTLIISVSGRIDATTAPNLETMVKAEANGAEKIVFNFEDVDYISSAGLRVILSTHKTMISKGGSFALKNVKGEIKSILEMTGFLGFVKVE